MKKSSDGKKGTLCGVCFEKVHAQANFVTGVWEFFDLNGDKHLHQPSDPKRFESTWPAPIPEPAVVDPAVPNNPEGRNLRTEAERWISANTARYHLMCGKALSRLDAGQSVNIQMLAEWARLEVEGKKDRDGFKLNNNHTAYIARRMVADHPRLATAFRFRETRY